MDAFLIFCCLSGCREISSLYFQRQYVNQSLMEHTKAFLFCLMNHFSNVISTLMEIYKYTCGIVYYTKNDKFVLRFMMWIFIIWLHIIRNCKVNFILRFVQNSQIRLESPFWHFFELFQFYKLNTTCQHTSQEDEDGRNFWYIKKKKRGIFNYANTDFQLSVSSFKKACKNEINYS